MSQPIPKWLQGRYALLLKEFKNKEFTFNLARNLLKMDQEKIVSITLSKLKKAGWLEIIRLDPNDSRKRYYKLKSLDMIFREIEK